MWITNVYLSVCWFRPSYLKRHRFQDQNPNIPFARRIDDQLGYRGGSLQ